MRRVAFIINSFRIGGAETQLISLIQELQNHGVEAIVLSLFQHEPLADQLKESGIKVHFLNVRSLKNLPAGLLRARRIVTAFRPDVIHSHIYHSNLFARLLKVFMPSVRVVNTAHNTVEGGSIRYLLYRITSPLAEKVSIISRDGERAHLDHRATPRRKLAYIPNGINVERFQPLEKRRMEKRKKPGVDNELVFLSVGALSEQKNYPNALHAVRLLKDRGYTGFRVFIAGKAPGGTQNDKKLLQLRDELEIQDMVQFLGLRNDIQDLMRAADGYVSSSSWEGMPIVLLEAAASGLPVAATDVGDTREIVREGKNGFLVPPKDPESLAEAMMKLLDMPEKSRLTMGRASRKHAMSTYSIESVAKHWLEVYG